MINDLVDQAALSDLRGPAPKPGTRGVTIPYHDLVQVVDEQRFNSAVQRLRSFRYVVEEATTEFGSLLLDQETLDSFEEPSASAAALASG